MKQRWLASSNFPRLCFPLAATGLEFVVFLRFCLRITKWFFCFFYENKLLTNDGGVIKFME